MDDTINPIASSTYERQLAHLKLIIPQLVCPQQINLCSIWIERFTSCRLAEEVHRSKLVNLFVRQLRENGRLGDPFLDQRNAQMPLEDIVHGLGDSLVRNKSNTCYEANETELCVRVNQALARFEYHLGQIEASDRPYEHLQRLQFSEYLDLGIDFRPIMERVQNRWTRIFDIIHRSRTQSKTPAESCGPSSSSASSSSELGQSAQLCTDPRHISTHCLSESPSKYKTFALKYAKRIEKLKQDIAQLKQNAQIQASTESIRFAALKNELVQQTGAKQQAEMCVMIDRLDERYREVIAKSMALGVAETKRAKAT